MPNQPATSTPLVIDPEASPAPLPNDHIRTLRELLRAGGADLMRRWVAALLLAPPDERPGVIDAVERRMVELYASPAKNDECNEPVSLDVAEAPVEHDGVTEQIIRTYVAVEQEDNIAPPVVQTRAGDASRRSAS